jgi:hypothetical protein
MPDRMVVGASGNASRAEKWKSAKQTIGSTFRMLHANVTF